jgi:hypothetical protein
MNAKEPQKGSPEFPIYRVQKRCLRCPKVWEGNAFSPPKSDGTPHEAICDDCDRIAQAHLRTLTGRRQPTIEELEIPRRAAE